ncbi:prolipoprotein diacylglyceryl transferase [Candidatus Bipolaricaulota bacterium]|nr:prolipoprotein diacylglyceryl transferase [Candidatus Bipolaricaulota bacterium]
MKPIAFTLGPLTVRWYGVAYAVALLVGLGVLNQEAKRKGLGLDLNDLIDFILLSFPLGLIGARIYYALFHLDYFLRAPGAFFGLGGGNGFGLSGLAIHGGLVGGLAGLLIFVKWKSVELGEFADALSPALILGQAIGRVGNFLNGDAFGYPTELPWGVVFPEKTVAGGRFPNQSLHPTMIYEMILDLLIFAFLWKLGKGKYRPGFIGVTYLITYSIGRSIVSFFRAGSLWIGPIRAAHLVSILIVAWSGYYLIDRKLYLPRS